jgi:hypothetical protein
MTKRQKRFTFYYWSLVFIGLALSSFIVGKMHLSQCERVTGKVVDQVNVPNYRIVDNQIRSINDYRPRIEYRVNSNTTSSFIDRSSKLPTGAAAQILYLKADPTQAVRYTPLFWINYSLLVPAFVIACFLFCVILITITNYGKQRVIVPGELDNFVSDKVSGSYTA